METSTAITARQPWNKGKLVGQARAEPLAVATFVYWRVSTLADVQNPRQNPARKQLEDPQHAEVSAYRMAYGYTPDCGL